MRIDNRTHWDTAALEVLIRAALFDAGVKPGHDVVTIVYSRRPGRYSGWCILGNLDHGWDGKLGHFNRMRLCLPRARELVPVQVAWLVRHEVCHWAGLNHHQMGKRLRKMAKPDEPMPSWVPVGWRCDRVEPALKPPIDKDERRAERRLHLESKVTEYEQKLARTERLLAKWRHKLKGHDAHYKRAALTGRRT